jgi:glutamate formiminotransferase/formiminotetrahydrofolate cyclodeaminase
MPLVECVPNFSEGRNQKILEAIADAIRSVEGVELLDIDPGKGTNRTVMTLAGEPEPVLEAAFQGIARAAALIDMRKHTGAHPRMGATDVCPFVPVAGVTMEACVELARRLGRRVGAELGIPVYLYGEAAQAPERRNLADIRKGEYEGLAEKLKDPAWHPDFGPPEFNPSAGATAIGARTFLIAYNVNLNTRSQKLANEIALTIREAGRAKRDEHGDIVRDGSGKPITVPGTLPACKAVGWYIDEYRRAQVSINLVDYKQTSLHTAFDEVCRQAALMGLRVTGSEIVGLVPLEPMLEAGRHYLARQRRSTGVSESELVETAIQSLGLSELQPFDPHKKIIEYRLAKDGRPLGKMTLSTFLDELASESPAPGGGSVAALCGALSAGLTAMVANLTHAKKGFELVAEVMNDLAARAQSLKAELLKAVDEDTAAFNRILEARRMPKDSEEARAARQEAIREASKKATLVPLGILSAAGTAVELAELAIEKGNPASVSDAGVAALTAAAAGEAAYYNVLINLPSIDDEDFCLKIRADADALIEALRRRADMLHDLVLSRL